MIDLVEPLRSGDRRALARLLTAVENERVGVQAALTALYPYTGHAWVIGLTGAPGTGKSSLVTELAKVYRSKGETVAILAVDPTSPFTGGAILGDRIRMRELSGDKGIFIRSMATRGSLGGLARATRDAVRVLDAAGFDRILVETVGAGQSEVEIARAAYTTIVIEAPGLGDDVQAIKAGILEIADVLVVNKADRPGVDSTVRALRTMLELGHPVSREQMVAHHGQAVKVETPTTPNHDFWLPPVIRTVATEGEGIVELVATIEAHRDYLTQANRMHRLEQQQVEMELVDRVRDELVKQLFSVLPAEKLREVVDQVQARSLDPQSAVNQLLAFQQVNVAK
ncbi:MAG: methylmalonyl Co-A mutase-associated GTPase MeaB [Anaerolineaceae bacterium]|nr:methylmalonyl Co-A mutase-associated GTPase MeaB [Anaerolineaceae bacterium]